MASPHLNRLLVSLLSVVARQGHSQLLSSTFLHPVCPAGNYWIQAMMHVKARCAVYPVRRDEERHGDIQRLPIPDTQVPWSVPWPDYSPPDFTAVFVLTAAWADATLTSKEFRPVWNALDGKVDRRSHAAAPYAVEDNRPLNPEGRTGLRGRGVLGRWGPNHAADPIVTRWQRDEAGEIVHSPETGRGILEFVSIERKDGGGWAIPGGMVDAGECVSATLMREFMEEAMDSTNLGLNQDQNIKIVKEFFSSGDTVYKGYVDDPRNTDNAWMETVAVNFHDPTGESVGKMDLRAGDDARNLKWQEVDNTLDLYASHKDFIHKTAELRSAHW